MKEMADGRKKEIEAEDFIISCLKKYVTRKILPPKRVSKSTIAPVQAIDGNYRVITLIFKKYGNLPLCLENYALFSLHPIFTNILYT